MTNEKELVDKIVLLESKEEYDEEADVLRQISQPYGFSVELTGDGNWILRKKNIVIDMMFDSSRGGDIPYDVEQNGKRIDRGMVDPNNIRKVVEVCITSMKKWK